MHREELTNESLEEMKALFSLFDIDGNGEISLNELETVMKTLGTSPPRYI
jgi:Ca2+-binding EF-hand superfamily protein